MGRIGGQNISGQNIGGQKISGQNISGQATRQSRAEHGRKELDVHIWGYEERIWEKYEERICEKIWTKNKGAGAEIVVTEVLDGSEVGAQQGSEECAEEQEWEIGFHRAPGTDVHVTHVQMVYKEGQVNGR